MRLLLCLTLTTLSAFAAATPPSQPTSGPGSSAYAHASVRSQRFESGAAEYWIYEPDRPRPAKAPVIVFSHGWGATDPVVYGAWIEHLVRRGNIVIYPRYQENLRTPATEFVPNALTAVKRALQRLRTDNGRVRPDETKFALVGHSMGGALSASLAALAAKNGLPKPAAVMCVQPGRTLRELSDRVFVEFPDLGAIPSSTLLISLAGDADEVVSDRDARTIFEQATSVLPANKNFILMRSDSHGAPDLEASHSAPTAPNGEIPKQRRPRRRRMQKFQQRAEPPVRTVDALDWYGTWKLFDALTDAAFYGKNREYALGNTPQQRFMGKWSDGVPVRELDVTLGR